MRKLIALMLALLMAVTFAACGTQADTNENDHTVDHTEDRLSGIDATEGEEADEPQQEVPEATEDDTPAFDTAWAGNDFEALLPQLPFEGWTTAQKDDLTYEMELFGLNTSGATNPPDSGEPDGADKQKLLDYLAALTSYGFTVEETGTDYQWLAKDAAGNEVEFMCADGGCWITIRKAS